MNLNSILIGSESPDRLVEFYAAIFGEPAWAEGGYTGWQLGSGVLMVGPHDEVTGRNPQPGRIIWNVESVDVRGDFARFRDGGATVVCEPYDPDPDGATGGLIATFADPDGNYFQLASPM